MGGDLWESEGKGRVGPIGPFPHHKEQVGDVLVKQPPPRPGERAVIPDPTLLLLLLLLLLLARPEKRTAAGGGASGADTAGARAFTATCA